MRKNGEIDELYVDEFGFRKRIQLESPSDNRRAKKEMSGRKTLKERSSVAKMVSKKQHARNKAKQEEIRQAEDEERTIREEALLERSL